MRLLFSFFAFLILFSLCMLVTTVFRYITKKWDKHYLLPMILISLFLSLLLPLELIANLFFSFESPEQICHQWYNAEPLIYVEGTESALLIYPSQGSDVYRGLSKVENGWKLKSGKTVRHAFIITNLQPRIQLIRVEGTNDYYVIVGQPLELTNRLAVSDGYLSEFKPYFEADGSLSYIAYIKEMSAEYNVSVDGEIYAIFEAYQQISG